MQQHRRTLLKQLGGFAALAASVALLPSRAFAAIWNKAGFEAKQVPDVLKTLGADGAAESRDILVKVPEIAENGAVVPVEIVSNLPGTTAISIVVDKNPLPLAATFHFSNGAEGFVNTRIKMGQTSNVRAVVQAGGKFYFATKEVKVTLGGCGG